MARRGARVLQEGPDSGGSPPDRQRPPSRHGAADGQNDGSDQDRWFDEGPVPTRPGRSGARRGKPVSSGADPALPAEVAEELSAAVGAARGAALAGRLQAAARAYARDRYPEALRTTKAIVAEAPDSASARELHGLVCYRMGRFREALRHLDAARALSGGDPSQLPVAMDCHRALGHHRRVAELWQELRAASPDADVLAEGRLVMAADLADRGDLAGASALLVSAGAARNLRHPAERHIRQWYLLADLSERAGDLPRARDLFARVVEADPDLADAPLRLAALGTAGPRRRPKRTGAAPETSRRRR